MGKPAQISHNKECAIYNKLTKLGDAIAISKSETMNHWPTDWLTDRPTDRGRG